MQGVPGLRCPECGHEAKRERDLLRPRRRWHWALLGLLGVLLAPGALVYRQFDERGWYWLLPQYKTIRSETVNGWRIDLQEIRDPKVIGGQRLVLKRTGCPTFTIDGWRLQLGGATSSSPDQPRVGLGEDLTGDGLADLIVADHSGGAHCCMTYRILSLAEDRIRQLQMFDTQNAGGRFHDLDDDGLPELETSDPVFTYWNTSYAGSPKPRVVLKWRDGRYQLAPDLMRGPAPDTATFTALARSIRESDDWSADGRVPPVDLWANMLDFIYTGHSDLGWKLLEDAWRSDRESDQKSRTQFMVDLIAQLAYSQYWEGVRAMNAPMSATGAGMANAAFTPAP
jgi:hypothetical protein